MIALVDADIIGYRLAFACKEEKPEFQVIQNLIARLDQKEAPMRVDVEDGKVTVCKGDDTVNMEKCK